MRNVSIVDTVDCVHMELIKTFAHKKSLNSDAVHKLPIAAF